MKKHIVLPRRVRRRASITAVIPCYNYGQYLPAATRSILDQPGVDARVVIIDDASPDGSGGVAAHLAERDPRVRVILHDENHGHIETYNEGLGLVDTEFATLVSADDVVAPRSLGRAVALMQAYSGVGMVYGHIATFTDDLDRKPLRVHPYHLWRIWDGDEWIGGVAGSGYNPIASPEAVVRTAILRDVGPYNAALPHSGDLEYWLRIAGRADIGQIHGPVQAYYRVHGGNMHTNSFGTRETDLRERYAAFCVLRDVEAMAGLDGAQARFDQAQRVITAQAEDLLAEEHSNGSDCTHTLVAFLRMLDAEHSPSMVRR